MTRPRLVTLVAGVAALGATLPIPAFAESPAEEAIHHGVELRRERRDAEALAEFRRAYALLPIPRVRAQIGLAEQALGQWLAAEEDLTAAIGAAGDPWIEQNRPVFEPALETIRSHLAAIEVTADAAGAVLRVNGALQGPLPRDVRVETGEVVLEVSAPDRAPVTRAIDVSAGVLLKESFSLPRVAPPPPPDERPSLPPDPRPPVVRRDPLPPSRAAPSPWGWVALGGAALSLGGGIAGSIAYLGDVRQYNDDPRCPHADRPASCDALRTQAGIATGLAVAGYVASGALAITGAIVLWKAKARPARLAAAGWVLPAGAGVSLGAEF